MRRTRDVALHAGFYLAAAISGLAAAYVLGEWVHYLWDAPNEKPSDTQPPLVTSDTEPSVQSLVTDEDTEIPSTSQTNTLPPLRTHSLPPPLPNAHALLSGSFVSIDPSSMSPQTSLNDEDGVEEEDAAQSNTSDSDSLIEVMSPHPPRVISRRRSMRAHDLFAESHISFSELGSLVAPQDEPE